MFKVKKNKKAKGIYFHKSTGIKCTHTKRQAMLGITKECGKDKFFKRNYIGIEFKVLKACQYTVPMYQLNLNKY